jgi:glycosyltransferase involved in cell wall biosynthesis
LAPRALRIAAHNGARAYGGGEKWTVLLLKGLQARGHEAHLFCSHPEVVEQARAEGVDSSLGPLGGHLMLPHVARFGLQLRQYQPEVLLIATFKKVWLGAMAARLAGVPRVVSRIGLDTDLPGKHWTYRLAYRRWVDAVLVNADGIRQDIVRGFPDFDSARVATVYDGIALSPPDVTREEARQNLGVPIDAPLVGSVTRLSGQKRLDRLMDAVALVPGIHLALAGEGELEGELRARAASLGITERVHFLGYRPDVPGVLAALDLFAITSDKEGMANAMLEAMAAGVPVVSTPVSGADEALSPDETGRAPGLVVAAEASALAEALNHLLRSIEIRRAMGEEGRRRARSRFSYDAMVEAWEAVLSGDDPSAWHRGAPTS